MQAVQIAKQMPGTPIKLLWSREEDMAQGRYHPVMQCKLVGAFDKDNNLTGLHMRHLGPVDPGDRAAGGRGAGRDATRSRSRASTRPASTRSATPSRTC